MCRQKLIPVLCIDEFERIGSKEEFSLDFFEGLRAMAEASDLVLLIASKSPLRQMLRKYRGCWGAKSLKTGGAGPPGDGS